MYDFHTLLNRRGTDSIKWDAMGAAFGRDDLMPFWVADGDFPVLHEIHEALAGRCGEEQTYGYTQAGERFRKAVIRWNRERHHLSVSPEEILPVPGVVTALSVVLLAVTEKGDSVIITSPVYTPFFHVVENLERTLNDVPLILKAGRYEMDFDAIEEKMAAGAKAFILSNPHNPAGRVWEREELARLSELCRKYRVVLISDEIHYDIVPAEVTHTPALLVDPDAVMLTAASKTFNIAGLKTSYMVVPNAALRGKISGWMERLDLTCNLFGFLGTAAAYENGAAWVDEMNAVIRKNAETAVSFFENRLPKVKAYVPESTYLLWLDATALGLGDEALKQKLTQAGVALNPGGDYGKQYEGFLRMNIAVPEWYLKEGLEKIAAALQ